MGLVVLRSFENGVEAHMLRSKLESEGIQSVVFDENTVGAMPIYSITVGGVKVMVLEEELERAEQICQAIDEVPYTDEDDKPIVCSRCGSDDLYQGKSMNSAKGFLAGIVSVLLIIYPLFYKGVYRCKSCGKRQKS
jgi:hypothetical protein